MHVLHKLNCTYSSQSEGAYYPARERPRLEPSPVHQHPVLVLDGVGAEVTGELEKCIPGVVRHQ